MVTRLLAPPSARCEHLQPVRRCAPLLPFCHLPITTFSQTLVKAHPPETGATCERAPEHGRRQCTFSFALDARSLYGRGGFYPGTQPRARLNTRYVDTPTHQTQRNCACTRFCKSGARLSSSSQVEVRMHCIYRAAIVLKHERTMRSPGERRTSNNDKRLLAVAIMEDPLDVPTATRQGRRSRFTLDFRRHARHS